MDQVDQHGSLIATKVSVKKLLFCSFKLQGSDPSSEFIKSDGVRSQADLGVERFDQRPRRLAIGLPLERSRPGHRARLSETTCLV